MPNTNSATWRQRSAPGSLRGKLLVERELAGTRVLAGWTACRYDLFTPDHLLNQALKFCNGLLLRQTRAVANRIRLQENDALLSEVTHRPIRASDLDRIHLDKLDRGYEAMLADLPVEAVIYRGDGLVHVSAALRAIEAGNHVLLEKQHGSEFGGVREPAQEGSDFGPCASGRHRVALRPQLALVRHFIREEMGEMPVLKA